MWISVLKLFFIAGLFTIYVNKFAWPSFKTYMDAGIIVEKSSVKREIEDSPAITFCAMKDENFGWKKTKKFDEWKPWLDIYCKNRTNIKDTIRDC